MLNELDLWQLVVVFGVSTATVVVAGMLLARHGDAIAVRTGLGGLFVGMLLLASATSLPEIGTAVAAAANDAPDLAVGQLLGSSMANMAILAVLDLISRRTVWPSTGLGHARLAALAMALTAVMLLGIVSPTTFQVAGIGLEPIVIVIAYLAAAAWIRRGHHVDTARANARPQVAAEAAEVLTPVGWAEERPSRPLRYHVAMFVAAAALVIVAAPFVALSAHGIAGQTGLHETFIGATLLAVATSLPELVASVAAVRIGAYDLAVGNLFGSNAFNATVILFADAAYQPGPILTAVGPDQLVAGLGAVLLMAIAIGGVVHGAKTRFERGEPDALLLLATYVALLWLLWIGPG